MAGAVNLIKQTPSWVSRMRSVCQFCSFFCCFHLPWLPQLLLQKLLFHFSIERPQTSFSETFLFSTDFSSFEMAMLQWMGPKKLLLLCFSPRTILSDHLVGSFSQPFSPLSVKWNPAMTGWPGFTFGPFDSSLEDSSVDFAFFWQHLPNGSKLKSGCSQEI